MKKRFRRTILTLTVFTLFFPKAAAGADRFDRARREMVESDIVARDILDKKVLAAMGTVPRHLFVPGNYRDQAYADHPLPIGMGQTISQPYVVALMTEALSLQGGEKVLEIGTGSGYQAAVLAEIAAEVYSVEIIPQLADRARRVLRERGYESVRLRTGDGYYGWEEAAPFDAVIVTAAANHIPPPLLEQLKVGGKLILPLGRTTHIQILTLVTREEKRVVVDQMGGVRFVPMVGEAQKTKAAPAAPR